METLEIRTRRVLGEELGVEPEQISMDETLLGSFLDSMEHASLLVALESEFLLDIPDEVVPGLTTLRKVLDYLKEEVTC